MKNLKLLLIICFLSLGLGFSQAKIICSEIHSFGYFENLFKNDACYDHNGRIYIKDFSNLSKEEINKFFDYLEGYYDNEDKSWFFDYVNNVFCYKLSDLYELFCEKIIFNEKTSVTKDCRFIGSMAYDVSTKGKSCEGEWVNVCTHPCYLFGVLYIQDKDNDIIIEAKFVESFEFTQDSKFVVITFKSGVKITFDLYAKKEVVALRDYSKKNGFFDECDNIRENN